MRRDLMETAQPEWPCPYCGTEDWRVERPFMRGIPPIVWAAECGHCHVLMDRHWIDGCWMGRWVQAGRIGCLADFVDETSEELRRG